MARQDEIFSAFEGDAWFVRNRQWLDEADPDVDNVLRLLNHAGVTPKSVLEVGAANGFRVASLVHRHSCRGVAADPSQRAVEDGKQRFPEIMILRAPAHDIPVDGPFDLVIVHFVLHWVDRAMLARSVAEIDRHVADGGMLLIGDFLPYKPTRVPYHHLPGVDMFTWKQDYSAPFLATGLYQTVCVETGGFAHLPGLEVEEHDRVALWLLRKSLAGYYAAE